MSAKLPDGWERCYNRECDYRPDELESYDPENPFAQFDAGCPLCDMNCWNQHPDILKAVDDKIEGRNRKKSVI